MSEPSDRKSAPRDPTRVPREVVLVSVGELGSGALEAHFGELARRLSPTLTVHWADVASPRVVATSRGRAERRAFAERARAGLSGSLTIVPCGPRLLGWRAAALALGFALRAKGVGDGAVLHARGYLAALVALVARRVLPGARVLHDVRGDRPAEVRIHGGEFAPAKVARLEGVACRRSDAHLAVSTPLRDVLRSRHGVEALVFQSAADTETFRPDPQGRERVRRELGIGDEILLGFVGSCSPWQRPDALVALFAALRRERPDSKLLVLSPDVRAWARWLRAHGVEPDVPGAPASSPRAFVRRAPHAETPAWFSACDFTALLRDDDDVNRVASPIKFGESLACGVPVAISRHVGDASPLVAERGVGVVVEDALLRSAGDEAALASFVARLAAPAGLREACRRAAVERWSWTSQVDARLAAYGRIARGLPLAIAHDSEIPA